MSRNNTPTLFSHAWLVQRAVALSAEYTLKHDESVTQAGRSKSKSFCDKVGGAHSLLFTVATGIRKRILLLQFLLNKSLLLFCNVLVAIRNLLQLLDTCCYYIGRISRRVTLVFMLNRLIYFYNMDVFGQNKSQTNSTTPTENWTSVSSFTSFYTNQSISHSETHTWRLSCTRHGIFSLNDRFKLQNDHNCFKYLRNNSNTLILI